MKWSTNKVTALVVVLFLVITYATTKRIGAICEDGTESTATGSGACSWHDGVEYWKVQFWWGTETTMPATGYLGSLLNFVFFVVIVVIIYGAVRGKD